MRKNILVATMLSLALLVGMGTAAVADPMTFEFTYTGLQNGASATGFIVFESTLLPNPGLDAWTFPEAAVLDLEVTVSGAAAGNGTFGIASFTGGQWNTNNGTLDLFEELVGQPTANDPWGTPNGSGGDFNLFAPAPAPSAVTPFILRANGGQGDGMVLTSMRQVFEPTVAIPTLDDSKLIVLALLLGLAGIVLLRRKLSTGTPR